MRRLKHVLIAIIGLSIPGHFASAQDVDESAYMHYISPELYGEFVDGFIVTKDYERIDLQVRYEYPTLYQNSHHEVLVLNEKGKQKKYDKSDLVGFGVNDQVFVPEKIGGKTMWVMLTTEGIIQQTVFFQPQSGHPAQYYVVNHIVTNNANNESIYVGHLAVNFNLKMSEMVADYPELAKKIHDKETGYHFVNYSKLIAEYNAWYNQQNPGEVHYILPIPDYDAIIAHDAGRLVKEEN